MLRMNTRMNQLHTTKELLNFFGCLTKLWGVISTKYRWMEEEYDDFASQLQIFMSVFTLFVTKKMQIIISHKP